MKKKTTLAVIGTLLPFYIQAENNVKNVLFIAIDDLRPALGCYGDPHAITPNIDTLADKGFIFQNAYCQQAVSGPSRASLLTGLRPDEINVTDLNTHFRKKYPDLVTLPQLFKNNGYETIGIGKIFHGSKQTQDTISWSRVPLYSISSKKKEYTLPENQHGKKATAMEVADYPDTCYWDGIVTQKALKTLDELSDNKQPFFLAVGFIKPHLPFSMPKKYWDLYQNKEFVHDNTYNKRPFRTPQIAFHNWEELRGYTDIPETGELSIQKQEDLYRAYYACISFIDAQVGLLLDKIKEKGLNKNTVIVLWGDHGFHLGEQASWCKSTNLEMDCRAPLIIYSPYHKYQPLKIHNITEFVDIYPTLADLCDLKPPHKLSGESLCPLMEGCKNWKDRAFSQFPRPYKAIHHSKDQTHMGYTVRVKNWRYTLWYDIKTNEITDRELYKLSENEIETINLSGESKYSHIEHKLNRLIDEYKHQTNTQ